MIRSPKAGFSLIELVVVITIVAALGSAVSMPLVMGVRLWNQIRLREDALARGRLAMERMVREISWISGDIWVIEAGSTQLHYATALPDFGARIFSFLGENLRMTKGGLRETLATGVSGFSFTYTNRDGATVASPTTTSGGTFRFTNIWRIRIQFTISSGNQTVTLQEEVIPRNFLRSNK